MHPSSRQLVLRVLIAFGILFSISIAGCSKTETETKKNNANDTSNQNQTANQNADENNAEIPQKKLPPVKVTPATKELFDETIKKHQGNVILVDFWGTWCAPCLKQFPHTVELHKRYAEKGLTVITMSIDLLDDQEKVEAKLTAMDASKLTNFITTYGVGQDSADNFQYNGDHPFYKLHDKTGKLRHTFSSNPSPDGNPPIEGIENIETRIKELLAE